MSDSSEKYVFDVKLASGECVSIPGEFAVVGSFRELTIVVRDEFCPNAVRGVSVFTADAWVLAVRRPYELKIAEAVSDDVPPEFKE